MMKSLSEAQFQREIIVLSLVEFCDTMCELYNSYNTSSTSSLQKVHKYSRVREKEDEY